MDFYAMRSAMNRALGLEPPTEANYAPSPMTVSFSTDHYYTDLIQRLLDRDKVSFDPLSKEAAEAIRILSTRSGETNASR